MLALAIIATVLLGLRVLIGWLGLALYKSDKFDEMDENVQGSIVSFKSLGLISIYIIVTIWLLYAHIG